MSARGTIVGRVLRSLTVAAVLGAPAAAWAEVSALPGGDIRDIRGPVAIEEERSWAPYAAGALALAGAGLGGRALARRRRRPPSPEAIAEARLAEAEAHRDELGADAYAAAISEAIRGYVQQRFGIVAPMRTTEEFLAELAGPKGPPALQGPELAAFLASCDRAKFARSGLSGSDQSSLLAAARAFVARSAREKTVEATS